MKKLLLIIPLLFPCSSAPESQQKVYICTGKYAKCYHLKKDCEGLQNCGGQIKEVTLEQAKQMGREKPCGYCAKKQ